MAKLTPQQIIDHLQLEPLPEEGGYFRRSYSSADVLPVSGLPARYRSDKLAGTTIYYLLTNEPDSFSALHRLPTDEVYHFYLGDPVELLLLTPDGGAQTVVLGQDILAGQQVQFVVPCGVWQGSRLRPGGTFALMGTAMAPGWTDDDYEPGLLTPLLADYPEQAAQIRRLIRH